MKILTLSKSVCLIILFSCFVSVTAVKSQSKIEVGLGADLVNSYVWRGYKQAGASVQPSLSASLGGFSLGAWASTDFTSTDGKKEVDFTASYQNSGFKIAATDYWWDGEGKYRYFSTPGDDSNGHYFEATLGYTLPESFPLSVTWNTFLLGKGNKKSNGNNSYSTYIELAYPFSVQDINMGISTGFTPWESAVYGTTGFKFTSITLSAAKGIKITDSYTLPVFANIICNPELEDIHFVFGISIK